MNIIINVLFSYVKIPRSLQPYALYDCNVYVVLCKCASLFCFTIVNNCIICTYRFIVI